MKNRLFIVLLFSLFPLNSLIAQSPSFDLKQLEHTHDMISLSPWGPYSKDYAGISHIPEMQKGVCFEFSVMPGFYRRKVMVPNVRFESGYHPWQVNANMDRITYRYELEWKDLVYTDVTYSIIDSSTVLASINCVNNTGRHQVISLNNISFIRYPEEYSDWKIVHSNNVRWINALSYAGLTYGKPGPRDNLVYDGWLRGEARSGDYIDSRAVAKQFGENPGDNIRFDLNPDDDYKDGLICFRYRMKKGAETVFRLSGLVNENLKFTGNGDFQLLKIPYESGDGDNAFLQMESLGGEEIELNGFFIGNENDVNGVKILEADKHFAPEVINNEPEQNMLLKYKDVDVYYGIAWDFSNGLVRQILNDELDIFLRENGHRFQNRYSVAGNRNGHFQNVHMSQINIGPRSERKIYMLICAGSKNEVERRVAGFRKNKDEFINKEVKADDPFGDILPEGEPFVFSQQIMRATLLTNVVYPVYTQDQYIRHFTPGNRWNSLYTWDNGFIAIGMNEIDPFKTLQCLNTYTTPEESQSAFIHHGTPVPVQIYSFFDYWNRTQSSDFLEYFYPRMKRYYDFLAGKAEGSTTNNLNSNILRTWDYFYNSGGWDDYPAQMAVHRLGLQESVAPVAMTAHIIRVAKILRLAAGSLGRYKDIENYEKDIEIFSKALQTHSWDEESGYFGYVTHDEDGNPDGILRHGETGENYNMGLEGAYPVVSGFCSASQQRVLLERIFSEERMWTPSGICVVDQSSPEYRTDGYWNGWVWMPHQWFVWKSMFDIGRPDLAYKIASKALEVWKEEVDASYNSFEIFQAETGTGAGWHQFSALSAPVLPWFNAYYKPGTVTTGFEIWIRDQAFYDGLTGYEAQIEFDKATDEHSRSLMICMDPGHKYKVLFEEDEQGVTCLIPGQLQVSLPATNEGGVLKVVAVN